MVARCRDADEFAGILAHEIGHNSHDHFGQGLGRSSVAGTFVSLGGLAGAPGRQLAAALGGAVLVQFTRAQEREADARAVDYASRAGYDPDGVVPKPIPVPVSEGSCGWTAKASCSKSLA